ncbi:MAG: 4'-phosphopantetheinyl transferase superfamily protein [Firmicutes bacterium]|nr:4'-phosphopantetheinyl transferase superfamily protein [Bacillota bacterium]
MFGAALYIKVFDRDVDRDMSLAARRQAAERYLRLKYGTGGIPVFSEKNGRPTFRDYPDSFSVCHSGNIFAVVFSGCNVALDFEKRPFSNRSFKRIVAGFFTENEKKQLAAFAEGEEKTEAFFDIWTKKEAAVKFNSTGISGMRTTDTVGMRGFRELPKELTELGVKGYLLFERFSANDIMRTEMLS